MKSEKVYIEYLLLKAQMGEKQAGEDLLAILQVKVKGFVLRILGGSSIVDDCIQETLLKVYRKMNQLRHVKAVHTWVYRIAYSTCMDQCRNTPVTGYAALEAAEDISGYEQQLDIKTAIATLPEEQQAIIFLFYYEGFNVAEVAEIMARPAGTIKYLLFTARDKIKLHLEH